MSPADACNPPNFLDSGVAVDIGGNYTLSRNWGNYEGETVANGAVRFQGNRFPEYRQAAWNYREGDLSTDQRHRSRLWLNYRPGVLNGLTLSVLAVIGKRNPVRRGWT